MKSLVLHRIYVVYVYFINMKCLNFKMSLPRFVHGGDMFN